MRTLVKLSTLTLVTFMTIQAQAKIKVVMKQQIEILPEAARVIDIPALPPSGQKVVQPTPAQPVKTPARIQTSSPVQLNAQPQNYYVSKTEAVDRYVYSRFLSGEVDQISLQFKTCYNPRVASEGQKLVLSDGMITIQGTLDSKGCFVWYQDLSVSSLAVAEGDQGVLQYVALNRVVRFEDGREIPQTFYYYPRLNFVTESTPRGKSLTTKLILLSGESL